jgi:hypothetical protein
MIVEVFLFMFFVLALIDNTKLSTPRQLNKQFPVKWTIDGVSQAKSKGACYLYTTCKMFFFTPDRKTIAMICTMYAHYTGFQKIKQIVEEIFPAGKLAITKDGESDVLGCEIKGGLLKPASRLRMIGVGLVKCSCNTLHNSPGNSSIFIHSRIENGNAHACCFLCEQKVPDRLLNLCKTQPSR